MLDTLLGFPLKLKKVAQWYFAVQHACRKPFYLDDYQLEWAQGPLALCMAGSRKPAWLCHWLQRMPSDYQALLPGSACCAQRHFRTDTWSFGSPEVFESIVQRNIGFREERRHTQQWRCLFSVRTRGRRGGLSRPARVHWQILIVSHAREGELGVDAS